MRKIALILGFFAWLGTAKVEAAPSSVSFAGRLSTADGPVNGPVNITFTFYDAQTGGTSVWSDAVAITAEQGLVFATLGKTGNELDETVFTGAARFLEIVVQGEPLSPRLSITSVPYAVRSSGADSADLLGTIPPDAVVTGINANPGLTTARTGNTVTLGIDSTKVQSRLTGSCPLGQSIRDINATGGVTCEIDNDTTYTGNAGVSITGTTVALMSCPAGQVLKSTGTGYSCQGDLVSLSLPGCTWESASSTTTTTSQAATCPSGKHPISGGCDAAGTAAVLFTRPLGPPSDGAAITAVSSWFCQFSAAATGHTAYALCCGT